jgi:peptidoglycan L-alanyl-D-glutamate endopeptidase CwlK
MANTKDLNNVVRDLMDKFIVLCKKNGVDVLITQGVRTTEYQNSLYAQGRTTPGKIVTNCKGGYSPHNYGLAFDFVLLTNGRVDWDSRNKNWEKAGKIGESIGLTWGGRWRAPYMVDLPHFEYMFGLSITDLRKGKRPEKLIKISSVKELANLKESDIMRIGKDIYKKI